jgi:hypothetical protein
MIELELRDLGDQSLPPLRGFLLVIAPFRGLTLPGYNS